MIDHRPFLLLALVGCSKAPEQAASPNEAGTPMTNVSMPAPDSAPLRRSEFTTLDMGRCRTIEENTDEGPYWLGHCPGYAGWQIEWSESDLRQDLTLIDKAGRKTDLDLSILIAKGAFNAMNGGKIEWRGDDLANPDTLIVRMNVNDPDDPSAPDTSKLAIIRLSPAPCVIGVAGPSRDQNVKARDIADGSKRECVKE